MEVKKFEDENVWKYVFHFKDAIAEAVLYRYETFTNRTVMCVSVQSGCPVGCVFCGTGKKFIRNLTKWEIVDQVNYLVGEVLDMEDVNLNIECDKFQIMFMSMGEPMLNFMEVGAAIGLLHDFYPNAQLLLSTIGVKNSQTLSAITEISKQIDKIGLQFSIHDGMDEFRNELIPYKNKMTLREIRDYGIHWNKTTGRPVYLNYCITPESSHPSSLERLKELFSPESFYFTFSVVCEKEEGKMSECDLSILKKVEQEFLQEGYNVRIFDPAGKDTIGGGCGQLWYVQDYFKSYDKSKV